MDHEEEAGTGRSSGVGRIRILIEDEDDPLADAADTAHDPSLKRVDWRIDRAKDEGTVENEPLQAVPDDVASECLDVDDDVRELGQNERPATNG